MNYIVRIEIFTKLKIKHGIDVEYFLDENNCNDKLKFYDNMPYHISFLP